VITNVYFECTREELNVLKDILNNNKDIEWACAYDVDEFDLCCGHFDIAYDSNKLKVINEENYNILKEVMNND
jgi:hypothetical protein